MPHPDSGHRKLCRVLAAGDGDMDGLVALLSSEVVLRSDGGGKGLAVPNPIHGAQNVARAILATLDKRLPKNLVPRLAQVNGEAGVVAYLDRKPYSVMTLDTVEGRVREIYIVTNPEKLAHLPDLPTR